MKFFHIGHGFDNKLVMKNPPLCIAILYFASVSRDARVLRQVEYLSCNYSVKVLGYGDSLPYPAAQMISLAPDAGHQRNTFKEKIAWRIQSGKILALPDRLHHSGIINFRTDDLE